VTVLSPNSLAMMETQSLSSTKTLKDFARDPQLSTSHSVPLLNVMKILPLMAKQQLTHGMLMVAQNGLKLSTHLLAQQIITVPSRNS